MSARRSLYEIFSVHAGHLTDKWQHYPLVYELEIGPLISSNQPINLLEIGVQNGGSLQIWSEYLPSGSTIVGIDVDPACLDLVFPNGVEFVHGSACDPETLARLPVSEFDVVIDDGSHFSADVIAAFGQLIDRVRPGGRYIIEDVETSYRVEHGGGFRAPGSTIEWAKGFIDAVNAHHITHGDLSSSFDGSSLQRFREVLWSIAFYDAVVSFRKLPSLKTAPFSRFFSGDDAYIMDPLQWVDHISPKVFSAIHMNEPTYRRIDTALIQRIQDYERREMTTRNHIAQLEQNISEMKSNLDQFVLKN